jgi:xanthine dehydrogenase accessory factor
MSVVVDARVAKEPGDTTVGQAPLVIALGPGFEAGVDCDAVVETNRGPGLGRVIWEGTAEDDTGEPAMIGGESVNRVIRSPVDGPIEWEARIGDQVTEAQPLGRVGETVIGAPISGVVRGLIAPGPVQTGLKVGDKSRSVGDGALEAVLTWIDR